MAESDTYHLVDSGNGHKLERFGPYLIARPAGQALWQPSLSMEEWDQADATLMREGEKQWIHRSKMPPDWHTVVSGIRFRIQLTDFGHLGLFPEQAPFWRWIFEAKPKRLLNLFAYSGGVTVAAARAGAEVCHLDASKGMVAWAKENAALNGLQKAPIRWIVDDVSKFLRREQRRGNRYDAIVLDPPTFGRGSQGEVFKIEEQIVPLLHACRELLTAQPRFVLLTCHTPGVTSTVLMHLLSQAMQGCGGRVDAGEMLLSGLSPNVLTLPSGFYARWQHA